MSAVIRVEHLSKQYRLGMIGGGTLREDLARWWALRTGKPDPLTKVGDDGHKPRIGERFWALRDVSFEVKQGEVLGIIGRNGAGKSTLLKILSRITAPTEGIVKIKGRVGSLLEVGTGFHPELTGRENIYLNGAILGMSRREVTKKLDEIIAFSECEQFIDTPVKRYSSGMYVRLAFAVAAHLDPEILIVDEVLAVGDAAFQKKCLGKMGDVAHAGRTVLFVSHNMVALRSLCPFAIRLDEGRLVGLGPAADVVSEYLAHLADSTHYQFWPDLNSAPGNDIVRIRGVWVEADACIDNDPIEREKEIRIGVEYWNLRSHQLHVTLHVLVEEQVVAFATASIQDPKWQHICRKQGLVRSICRIPPRFLNTGGHRVKLMIVIDQSRASFVMDNAVAFEVIEGETRGGGWLGKEPGVVRPAMPWSTELIQAEDTGG